ncbi:MAG: efflux RND transporter periplasmic adaptor subunit [Bacteroidota bacterium]
MKKNTINIIITLSLLTAASVAMQSCTDSKGKSHEIPKSAEPIPVKVVQLMRSNGIDVITASGKLTTDDETVLGFKTGGIVKSVLVKEGDPIKKGQLLATLDLTEINAQVAQAHHAYEKAQRDFTRIRNLYQDSVATLEQLQNVETALAVAKEQFEAATFNKSFSEIHASANGYVLRKFANAGQVVGVGDPIVQTNGAGEGNWVLKIGVSDKQWSIIKLNSSATVQVDAFPGRIFNAVVTRKSETADSQTGAFSVELQVKSEGVKFASGMFGSATLSSGQTKPSWSVPYEAVLDASGQEGFVFITPDGKTAFKQPVTISSFDGNSIRIGEGLENATTLIVSGSAYLSDRSPISIVK